MQESDVNMHDMQSNTDYKFGHSFECELWVIHTLSVGFHSLQSSALQISLTLEAFTQEGL